VGQTSSGADERDGASRPDGEADPAGRTLASVFAELDELNRRIAEHRRRARESRDHPRSA